MIVLSTAYLGNIQYYSKLLSDEECFIEANENYIKQSYRNRCDILSANGVISLSIPVIKRHGEKMPIREVEIDYTMPWQKQHWKSIVSAYKSSPFFDYYEELFIPHYTRKAKYLIDFNQRLMDTVAVCLGVSIEVPYTDKYVMYSPGVRDFRNTISPKSRLRREDSDFFARPYYQVFSEKFPFQPNLSIIDLLFCEGTEAKKMILMP